MPLVFSSDDSDLISSLIELSEKSPKLVRSSLFAVPADPSIEIRSWKMNEFKYYDVPSPFPTLARGLFSKVIRDDDPENDDKKKGKRKSKTHRIVVRGYDKFFNIGEVPWTSWAWLEEHTRAPYTLSLKSNGCIIFIAALTPTKLLITSKHSLGPVQGVPLSHAQAGEIWLKKYLDKLDKTEENLAAELWEKNWTAIAELCDDSFEEHVLGYPQEKTGLHLHGLNVCTGEFNTMPTEVVDDFAERWGFIKTATKVVQSIHEVKDFTDSCAERGEWNGEPVEGFVVRTHVISSGRSNSSKAIGRSPYAPGSSFFFKVKFDEPYMMYRDWREVTKKLLASKGPMKPSMLPRSKMNRSETKVYVKWVINEIATNPTAFADYNKGKGIIATREKFLAWLSEHGEEDLKSMNKEDHTLSTTSAREFGKTIIVPVAIPGCGKTTVSVALSHLFGFGHTQSDDIQAKKAAPVFINKVTNLLKKHDVVVADKNNHLRQHRQQLRDATAKMSPPVRLLALNWALDKPPAMIHRICSDRVLGRGENHQSLRADVSAAKSHEGVIWMFINSTEDLVPDEVDAVIDMDIEENLEQAVARAAKAVAKNLNLELPSDEKIAEVLRATEGYVPAVKKSSEKKKVEPTRYFALLPEVDLLELLEQRLSQVEIDENIKNAWEILKVDRRVTHRPHVTIVHRNNIEAERELWDRCAALHTIPSAAFIGALGRILWNGRVMAVTLDDFSVDDTNSSTGQGVEFISMLPDKVRQRLHITVGTKSSDIAPVEAREMVRSWNTGLKEGIDVQELGDAIVRGRIKGLIS